MPAQTATRIDITRPNREKVEALMNQLLADLTVHEPEAFNAIAAQAKAALTA